MVVLCGFKNMSCMIHGCIQHKLWFLPNLSVHTTCSADMAVSDNLPGLCRTRTTLVLLQNPLGFVQGFL